MKHDIRQAAKTLVSQLKAIDYERLPISKYNKCYIARLKPVLSYYMKIYADCLLKGLESVGSAPKDITFIDYGGGSGFLSMLAKQAGIGRVIYIDLNPDSVDMIRVLKALAGTGPDIILHGDSDTLADWCSANKVKPQLLIATDLIEHVYDLSAFFANLAAIDNKMQMLFTTASTPFNPYVKRKLHRLMTTWEKEYYALRLHYIHLHFPALSPAEAKEAARKTRGLTFPHIRKAVENGSYPLLKDAFNTCDPRNGNWTERILPIETYRSLAKPFGYQVQVGKGFYNTDRPNPISALISSGINGLIRISGKAGFLFAPFITLYLRNDNKGR